MKHLWNAYDEIDAWVRDLAGLGWMVIRTFTGHGQAEFADYLDWWAETWGASRTAASHIAVEEDPT